MLSEISYRDVKTPFLLYISVPNRKPTSINPVKPGDVLLTDSMNFLAQIELRDLYLYRSDSRSVSCRAISMGCRVIRSRVSLCPTRQMCHSMGGGGLSKVML